MHLVSREKPVKTTNEHFGKVEIPIRYQAATSLKDASNFVNGDEKLLAVFNDAQEAGAMAAARLFVSDAPATAKLDDVIAEAQKIAENYNVAAERQRAATQKVKAQVTDKVAEFIRGGNTDLDAIRAMLVEAGISV